MNTLQRSQLHLNFLGDVFSALVRLSAAWVVTRFFSIHHSSLLLSKGNLLFIALCGGMQGRKEEGKTMVSMATRLKKPTQSCLLLLSCLRSNSWWTRTGLSVFWRSYDWLGPILNFCVCLTFFFFGNKSAGLSQWTLVDDFFAVGLQQCQCTRAWALSAETGRERVDRERDQGKKRDQAIL